ncbi:MAG TPA: hypothetical protein V6D13_01105 [Halomicronema sp.]
MTAPVIKPTIQLFLYDLQEGLGQKKEQIKQNRLKFWQRIYKKITSDDELKEYKENENSESRVIVSLYGTSDKKAFNNHNIDGGHYAFQLGDTYILFIDCSGEKDKTNNLEDIYQLIDKNFQINEPTIGKTCLILGQLPANCQNIEQTAKDYYSEVVALNLNWDKEKVKTENPSQLLGGYLFECQRFPKQWLSTDKIEAEHHLVWLFPNDITQNKTTEIININTNLIRLFCHRHKIILAYYQSRQLKDQLKNSYAEIKEIIATFIKDKNNPEKMQETLTKTLDILANLAVKLNDLLLQKRTLEINLENYNNQIEILQKKDSLANLESFQKFSQVAENQYLKQIESDYTSLSPALTLLENFIKTIEGFNQIEQTRTEQNLNLTIGISGLGLAASGITATLISTQIPTPQPNTKEAYSLSHAFAISFAVFIGWAIGVFWNYKRR